MILSLNIESAKLGSDYISTKVTLYRKTRGLTRWDRVNAAWRFWRALG